MADKPAQPPSPVLPPFRESSAAPFIYFDIVPAYGIFNGAIQLELSSRILTPSNEAVSISFRESGHLRCSPAAAIALRDSINKALDMMDQAAADTQRVAANKLN